MEAESPKLRQPPAAGVAGCIRLPKNWNPGEPERYRLSAARLNAPKREPPSTPVHFWFRTRYVSALATDLSRLHPHVFKLQIRPSVTAGWIQSCVRLLLPTAVQAWARAAFPEWFLPDTVVIKQEKRAADPEDQEVMEELFDNEIKAYDRLKPLQGEVIPAYHGRIRYYGRRALILQHLAGVSLASPEAALLTAEELSTLLQPCYRALHAFGVHHDDPNLANFQLVDGKLMVLDLESADFSVPQGRMEFFMASCINRLVRYYLDMQACFRRDGDLEAAD
ncbi:hypothetical protein VTK73DRAFT_8663 [Phialemonium thermophilum]|uniref:Lipopolysaccharide kinase (Kdo/WaaP) family protein n=1 Tax=Phialemonium thermophilum TaxID=223376 RepID=A0ABR3XN09_9PEZI